MSQYIGKTISLISNKNLRYVGILENINGEDATVSLKLVRPFGTEGRMAAQGLAHMEVMPGADIYDFVVFRGTDVRDLTVLDEAIDDVQPQPYTGATYPAVPTQGMQAGPTGAPAQAPSGPGGVAQQQQAVPTGSSDSKTEKAPESKPSPTPASRTKPEPSATTKEKSPKPVDRPEPEEQSGEFDFEKANARFEKKSAGDQKPKYDKSSSFFDTISSSNTERGNMRWNEERSLNMDTFGQEGSRGRGNWRGRGRGRGRGGRGRGGRGGRRSEPTPEWA